MTDKLNRALMALRLEAPQSVVDAMTRIIEEELEGQKTKHLRMILNAHKYATTSIEKKTLEEVAEMITGKKFEAITE